MVRWPRIHLQVQGIWIRSLVREDPHAAEQLSPRTATAEPACLDPGSITREAFIPQRRVAPTLQL